jgi:hypothetical protein
LALYLINFIKTMQESRDHIKTRMLKNASRAWGYSETESENNFDPLVSMLLTACSTELEKISGEIHASRARVLSRLVQLLSPDALTGALPAHAVACATPVEKRLDLREDLQFYTPRKLTSSSENEEAAWKDVFFSPTANFRLTRASIRFMAAGNSLYRISNHSNKEIVAHTDNGKSLPANSLWLAIDEPGTSLQDCLFYFDLRNEAGRQLFYHQLPKATWYWNDQPVSHSAGYGERSISGEQLDLDTILNREDDPGGKIKKQVNAFYKSQFITLLDEKNLAAGADNSVLSGMIADCFSPASLQKLGKQPLRWVCIDFPQTVSTDLLQDTICVMNCFPVINRRLHELSYRLQEIVNIVPLQTEDLFFDLTEVSTDEGKMLNVRTFQQTDEGSFAMLMRNGGVGRFDERDAGAIVDYLLQLLRDESAAFSTLGNDFMNSEMRQLQQIMNKLEQRLFSRQLQREQTPYLVIRNHSRTPWQNIFIRYWSTTGAEGNNIKGGSSLRVYKGSGMENNQALLVTTTQGGRNKLGNNDSVLAYKSALLSRDRLITEEDIKAFCHYQLGDRVKKINIEKGIMIHPDERQGFVKTVDVKIDIDRKSYDEMLEKGEISFWKDNLTLLLQEKSVALLPFRVFIGEAA